MPLASMCTPWKETSGLLMISGGIEIDERLEMGEGHL